MKTIILTLSFPPDKRILIVSDLHAHKEGFVRLLENARFSKDDILVIVGDILEKGTESLSLLRHIMRLSKTHTVYTLMGNVDYWRLVGLLSDDVKTQKDFVSTSAAYVKWWDACILSEMLSEIGLSLTEDLDTEAVFPILRAHFKEEIDFLSSLPAILETDNMIFVHGGIPHENVTEFENEERHRFLKWDHFLSAGLSFSKYVVVGHWPVTLYSKSYPCANPIIDKQRRILSIDGGCGVKKEGQINLIIMKNADSEDFSFMTWDGLKTVTALDHQAESESFGYIRWGDCEVDVVSVNGDTARVFHHGKEMEIPSDCLYKKDDGWYSNEITDYCLPVSPGDTLSVIKETPRGLYAKKDGVTGWYEGRYM